MLLFRLLILLLLLCTIVSFALFIGTGQQRFKRTGLLTLKWALIAACTFFGALVLGRVI